LAASFPRGEYILSFQAVIVNKNPRKDEPFGNNRFKWYPIAPCGRSRCIELSSIALKYLESTGKPTAFVFGGKKPFSYTQVRKMCALIQKDMQRKQLLTEKMASSLF
jgi:hypothetical protein